MQKKATSGNLFSGRRNFLWLLATLGVVLIVLFHRSFLPRYVLASNDGPLGAVSVAASDMPSAFRSVWYDLNSIGQNNGSFLLPVTGGLIWLLGPLGFAKIYVPLVLLLLGSSAWLFFKQLRFSPVTCLIGGIGAALSSGPFSTACWGVGAQTVGIAMAYLAMAAVVSTQRPAWLRLALGGLAVGIGVMEAADIGALLSLMVAGFAFFHALTGEGPLVKRAGIGVVRVACIAAFAVFIAAHSVTGLVGTQIKGVAGMQQDAKTKAMRWYEATQWSLPKTETLGLVVPGLFGYRMDTPLNLPEWAEGYFSGGNYWGRIGRDAGWDEYLASNKQGPAPGGGPRQSGGGAYEGVLVALLALWAVFQAWRKDSIFNPAERRLVWFWSALALVALLLAFGKNAPFYQIVYALPYFSTIRNPAKFLHYFNIATVVLFAFGLNALIRRYLEAPSIAAPSLSARIKNWWAKAGGFEKRWFIGCGMAFAVSVLGLLVYASSRPSLEQYIQNQNFAPAMAKEIAGFSIRQLAWFVALLAASIGVVLLAVSGAFAGGRAKTGAVLLGLLLVVDLATANLAWIVHWDYKMKYATDPILDLLAKEPYQRRVGILPFTFPPQFEGVLDVYRYEWAQHTFLKQNIQSIDVVQMARRPQNLLAFETAVAPSIQRRWQLTNTRYLVGPAGFLDGLNQQLDPARHRFRILATFSLVAKPGVEKPTRYEQLAAEPNPNGPFAIFEFDGALPRVKLFSNWHTATNDPATINAWATRLQSMVPKEMGDALVAMDSGDQAALYELGSDTFVPEQSVLVSDPLPAPAPGATNQNAGTVEFKSYAPKNIKLHASVQTPAVLLLNDKYDPAWKVTVDDKPAKLLRANFIMRGVQLSPGDHTIEFIFDPPAGSFLHISLAAMIVGVLLLVALVLPHSGKDAAAVRPQEKPASAKKP